MWILCEESYEMSSLIFFQKWKNKMLSTAISLSVCMVIFVILCVLCFLRQSFLTFNIVKLVLWLFPMFDVFRQCAEILIVGFYYT